MKRLVFAILLVVAVVAGVLLALNRPGAEASPDVTITVNSTLDTLPLKGDGALTLREAIMLATGVLSLSALGPVECAQVSNSSYGPPCSTTDSIGAAAADTIVFDLAVFNPATITLVSTLPTLSTGDDTVDGSSAGVSVDGVSKAFDCFEITSNNNAIKGLEIYNCDTGVYLHSGAAQNNTVGGSGPGERNVISGNGNHGVFIGISAQGNVVKGNYIGTDASGTAAVPSGQDGVTIAQGAQNNTVEGNVISGNYYCGVVIADGTTDGNVVKGNYIGTNAAGDAAVPNGWEGVAISSAAQNNTVGGSTPGEGNVISGNGKDGLTIADSSTDDNVVKGNYIGTNASGTAAVPNGGQGVLISTDAQDNTIGGTASGEGNTIAFNTEAGVQVDGAATTGNTIRGNSIHSNSGKGIENINGGNSEVEPPTITGFASVEGTAWPSSAIDVYSDDEDEGRVYEGSTTADGDGNWSFPGTPEGPNITATATDSDGNTSEFSAPMAVPEPMPSPTPSPTPLPGPTRTLVWGPGWHNVTWTGASTPEEAFACAAGNYAAAYRLVGGGWERYFPDRPDISNMTDLEQYDAFLILVTGDVTCDMPMADPPGTERTLDWGVGWQNDGWTGADGTAPEEAFACVAGSYAAAYRLVAGGWERYFPDRPDISNMGSLNHYDPFLILVTEPVSCSMPIAP
jgi:parallel beta-helix repeat protein